MRRRLLFTLLPLTCVALAIALPLGRPCDAGAQARGVERTHRGGPALRVSQRVITGVQPKSVTLSPDGRRVWVCNFGRPDRDNMKVYDADSLELVGTVNFEGNAVETAAWMKEQGFRSLRLVTASYHMPRSLLEFNHAMPELEIVPHPVFPAPFKGSNWWRRPSNAQLVAIEFTKYLIARLRTFVS